MPYDLTTLDKYLSDDTNPTEVIQALRFAQHAVVRFMAHVNHHEDLADCYLSLVLLEDEFLKLEGLERICMKWK